MNQLLTFIYTVVTAQSLLLSIFFFLKKDNKLANRIFGFLFALMTLSCGAAYLSFSALNEGMQNLDSLWWPTLFLYAPLLYLYVMVLIKEIDRITPKQILRILPFLFFALVSLIKFFNKDMSDLPFYSKQEAGTGLTPFDFILIQGALLQVIIYIIYLLGMLKNYSENIRKYFSDIDKLKLQWLMRLLSVMLFIVSMHFLINIASLVIPSMDEGLLFVLETSAGALGFVGIFIIAYKGLSQPEMFDKISEMTSERDDKPKYSKQRLDESTELKLLDDLVTHMKEKKPYLDNNLTLKQLSDEVSIPTHLITMVLNLHLNQNYYSFINSYRIKEACRLLSDPEKSHRNILTIAMDTGFNSKSTFNTIFRKTTGSTPREFRSRHL